MRATLDTRDLKSVLATMTKVAPAKGYRPILNCVRLALTEDAGHVEATDLEIWARREIDARVETHGTVCVNARDLAKALPDPKSSPDVILEADADWLTVRSGTATRRLKLEDAESFPSMEDHESGEGRADLKCADLANALERAASACSDDSARFSLSSVFVEWTNTGFHVTGTNGHILSFSVVRASTDAGGGARHLVPEKHAKFLASLCKSHATDRAILTLGRPCDDPGPRSASHDLQATVGDWTVYCRQPEGFFPDYRLAMPSSHDSHWDVEAGHLLDMAADAIKARTDETGAGMQIRLTGDGMSALVAAGSSVAWQADATCIHRLGTGRAAVIWDSEYVRDLCKPIVAGPLGRRQWLRIMLTDPTKKDNKWCGVSTIQTDDGTLMVVMPLSSGSDPWASPVDPTPDPEPEPEPTTEPEPAPLASADPEPETAPIGVTDEPAPAAMTARDARLARYERIGGNVAGLEARRNRQAKLRGIVLANRRDARAARHAKIRHRCESWGVPAESLAEETERRLGLARFNLAQARQWRTRKARYARLDPSVWTESDPMLLEKARRDMASGPALAMLARGRAQRSAGPTPAATLTSATLPDAIRERMAFADPTPHRTEGASPMVADYDSWLDQQVNAHYGGPADDPDRDRDDWEETADEADSIAELLAELAGLLGPDGSGPGTAYRASQAARRLRSLARDCRKRSWTSGAR